jgi:hypothetical protein
MSVMQILPTDPLRKLGTIVGWGILCSGWSIPITFALWFGEGKGWFDLGAYGPWLLLIGLEYGFLLGVAIGVVMCAVKWRFVWDSKQR